jgi:hypothetical protein
MWIARSARADPNDAFDHMIYRCTSAELVVSARPRPEQRK